MLSMRLFALFESAKLPMAGEAVLQIKKLYDVKTQTRLLLAPERMALRQEYAKLIFDDLEVWLKSNWVKSPAKRRWPK